jgi:hypothetical protein
MTYSVCGASQQRVRQCMHKILLDVEVASKAYAPDLQVVFATW